jgi:hypothetical protein
VWPLLDPAQLDATFSRWVQGAAVIVGRDRVQATRLAGEYLGLVQAAAGVEAAALIAPSALDAEQFATSMRVTGPVAAKRSIAAGSSVAAAMDSAFTQSAGAATRLVMDAGREALMMSAIADPNCQGWRRVSSGRACDFCEMLAGRGGVYSADSADFPSHDHCMCSVEPVYDGEVDEVEPEPVEVAAVEQVAAAVLDVAGMTDAAIEAELGRLMEAGDFDSPDLEALTAELDARDAVRARYSEEIARDEWLQKEAEDRAAGIRRRRAGPSTAAVERALRDEYETWVGIQYLAAESATAGHMLSHAGLVEHIHPRDLFTRQRRSLKWASPELQEWFARNPRMSYQEFRAGAVQDDLAAGARRRSANRGWESEFG